MTSKDILSFVILALEESLFLVKSFPSSIWLLGLFASSDYTQSQNMCFFSPTLHFYDASVLIKNLKGHSM